MKAFCDAYDFKNLKFEDEERDSKVDSDVDEAIVVVTLERKLKNAFKFDFIEEKIKLKKNPKTGQWNVLSSDMKIQPAHEKMVRSSQDNTFIS